MTDAAVWSHPARRSGDPCVGGTRVPVNLVIAVVWAHGVAEAETSYDLSRQQILGACWYAGVGNAVSLWGKGGLRARRGPWHKRWGQWAEEMHTHMWHGNWDDVTDPPTQEAGE